MTNFCDNCGEEFEGDGEFVCQNCEADEMETYRIEFERGRSARQENDAMRDAYDPSDPKHPDFASVLDRADDLRKRGRGE